MTVNDSMENNRDQSKQRFHISSEQYQHLLDQVRMELIPCNFVKDLFN
jgi:hypothetical protein